jgi:hypothetical protein
VSDVRPAREVIEDLRVLNSKALDLACIVSLASRIEPELLRSARLNLDGADAGTEADVWLSALMQSRNASFALMRADVAHELRKQAKKSELLATARNVIERVHRGAPPSLQVEEEITWRSLVDANDPHIDRLFESVLVGLKETRPGLARWVARVLPRMPEEALESGPAQRVRLRASELLGGRPILASVRSRSSLADVVPVAASTSNETIVVGIRMFETSLRISEPPELHTQHIEVPIQPLVLEVSWRKGDEIERRLVSFGRGSSQTIEIGPGILSVRTATGDMYTLTPLASRGLSGHTSITTNDGFTLRVYRGDNSVLLAMDAERERTKGLRGFSLSRLGPDGVITALGGPEPVQRFHWIDQTRSGPHTYYVSPVTARSSSDTVVATAIDVETLAASAIGVGFTRPLPTAADLFSFMFPADPKRAALPRARSSELSARGGTAYKILSDLVGACIDDSRSTLKLLTAELDDEFFVKSLGELGARLRLLVDRTAADVIDYLRKRGCQLAIRSGKHPLAANAAIRFIDGNPHSATLGSTSLGVASLYARRSYVLRLEHAAAARALADATDFGTVQAQARVTGSASFPGVVVHVPARDGLRGLTDRVAQAKSSILFCLPEEVSEALMDVLQTLEPGGAPFVGGIFYGQKRQRIVWGSSDQKLVTASHTEVPPPSGNFIVVDFNQPTAAVIAGSLSFKEPAATKQEVAVELADPAVATVFAVEVLDMIDGLRFRAAATRASSPTKAGDWLRRFYTGEGAEERTLFAATPPRIVQQQQQQQARPPVRRKLSKKSSKK